jgi:hypothetical protein
MASGLIVSIIVIREAFLAEMGKYSSFAEKRNTSGMRSLRTQIERTI